MGLGTYRSKRDFTRTREPQGLAALPAGRRFVIQKHDAKRLHYDFRLELDGVLKSWAVPKGPSARPGERRLAVHVEDHPIDYGDFEGTIPEGEYGAGAVLVWDQGVWESEGEPAEQYAKGKLRFCLEGRRLKGCWTLVRMGGSAGGKDKENWLLIRRGEGEDAPPEDPERSVLTGRTLEEIAAGTHAPGEDEPIGNDPPPNRIEPQLARLVEQPPPGEGWLFEIKFDGYRILARREGGSVRLLSRNGKDWTERFQPMADAIAELPFHDGWLDGEVAILRPDGTTSFQDLQNAISEGRRGELVYLLFDLMHLNGRDLRGLPLGERKAALQALLGAADPGPSPLRFSDHVRDQGEAFYRQACELGLEGVIAKRAERPYRGGRGDDWRKIKCLMRQEFVVAGFTEPAGSRHGLGALLVGHRDAGGLRYAGKVGTGFDDRALTDLRHRLDDLIEQAPAFADPPERMKGVHWTRPLLVAEVAFGGWTRDGLLRHPSYQGLREDKDADEVTLERPESGAGPPPAGSAAAAVAAVGLSNPDKVLFPDQGLTKHGLACYYAAVAERMLSEAADRPLMLMRCPQGRHKHCFFQKHAPDDIPAGLAAVDVSESDAVERYLAVTEPAGLASLVQLGVLEIHLWGARRDRLERPDRMIFDLDPAEGLDWKAVVAGAREVRALLEDELGLQSFLRTTGGKGLHLVVPLDRRHGWAEVKGFSRSVAERLARAAPERYTATLSKSARRGRIFVDYLRNGRGSTAIASYSTRARPGATVATPIAWDELSARLHPERFNTETVPRRLASLDADPWEAMAGVRQSLTKQRKRVLGLE